MISRGDRWLQTPRTFRTGLFDQAEAVASVFVVAVAVDPPVDPVVDVVWVDAVAPV